MPLNRLSRWMWLLRRWMRCVDFDIGCTSPFNGVATNTITAALQQAALDEKGAMVAGDMLRLLSLQDPHYHTFLINFCTIWN
mmetsp:Transcript_18738/g.31911  ORF Transcript_18738/g.31911 Transcript_18738/m.31911 type:complete len:82 (-) Transcript_18738:19-264(-)